VAIVPEEVKRSLPTTNSETQEVLLMANKLTRRRFVQNSAAAAASLAALPAATGTVLAGNPTDEDTSKILNYNSDMEYRRCGRTGMMVSAAALGGH